jgi:uncharacterized membrane protein
MAENLQNQSSSSEPLSIRQVPAGNAWAWVVNGFNLFKANPAMWIILLVIYLAIMIPVSMLPVIGSVVSTLLAPVFAAGMMWGCQALVRNQDLEINHLFEGFKHNTSQLIAIGGIYMACLLFIAVIVVLAMDKDTVELLVKGQDLTPEQADSVLMPVLMAMLLVMPVLMAYWFAPILAGLHNLTALEAMKLSFAACLKNMLPFLLYGVIFMVLLIIAIIPVGLGLVIVVPMMMTSLYASYTDIFSIEQPKS